MPLSDVACRNAKPGPKPQKLADGEGLYLFVSASGGKLWRCDYRHLGARRTASFGAYPYVSLAEARAHRQELKSQLAKGIDPAEAKRSAERKAKAASANTFAVLAAEYMAELVKKGRAHRTIEKTRWLLDMADAKLGRKPIGSVTPAEVLEVLRGVERRGHLESARRLRSTIGAVFRYAIATARAETDPTQPLKGALASPKVTSRAAVTSKVALGGLLRAVDAFDGQPTTRIALQLMALLFPRPGELRLSEWSEFDLGKAEWSIPASRTKMRRPHRMPLPPQAVELLKDLQGLTGEGRLLFPGVRSVRRPISDNTLNAALRRMGYTKADATAHGFRATASTLLNESGLWNPDAIERQLAHIEGNDVRRAYARGEHWEERMRMMRWWADFLDEARRTGSIFD